MGSNSLEVSIGLDLGAIFTATHATIEVYLFLAIFFLLNGGVPYPTRAQQLLECIPLAQDDSILAALERFYNSGEPFFGVKVTWS